MPSKPDLDAAIQNQQAQHLLPIIKGVYDIESSSGKADTSKPNYAGARGPMQVRKQTFDDVKKRGLIPEEYKWSNGQHALEAGVAYLKHLSNHYKTTDPRILGAAYNGGPSAVNKDGTIDEDRVGDYANKLAAATKKYTPKKSDWDDDTPPTVPPPPTPAEPEEPLPLPFNFRLGGRVRII